MQKRKKHTGWIVVLCMAAVIAAIAGIYCRSGGFGTGGCADTGEFSKYAAAVSELTIPDEAQIVALGEATHGNREFQQLRLDVFQVLAEKYGVRAFALEGDFGGCEAINRYIHGAGGTAAEAFSATGFAIYRTEEMENLVEWMREYNASAAPGADVLVISSLAGDYEAVISYILPGRTVAFIGSSGVGKSTLINKLAGMDRLATHEIGNDDKGRHTTTHRELIALSNGAFVIDTPGMRELGMWDSGDGIDTAFADIEELSRACKHADCTHTSEPGCAVLRAIEDGTLDAVRLASYRKLKTENGYAADNRRYLEAKRTKFKEISKINKSGRKRYADDFDYR